MIIWAIEKVEVLEGPRLHAATRWQPGLDGCVTLNWNHFFLKVPETGNVCASECKVDRLRLHFFEHMRLLDLLFIHKSELWSTSKICSSSRFWTLFGLLRNVFIQWNTDLLLPFVFQKQ